jgi:hypothetical protein
MEYIPITKICGGIFFPFEMILVVTLVLLDKCMLYMFCSFVQLRCRCVNEIDAWIYSTWYMRMNHQWTRNFIIHKNDAYTSIEPFQAYDLLGLYFGIGRTFFNPASVSIIL